MDSLKLDRFRKLLNRQNTTINVGDTSSPSANNTTATASLPAIISATATSIAPSAASARYASDSEAHVNSATYTTIAISVNIPNYVTKDNPTPAVFMARKLFSDFIEIAGNKIEIILEQEPAARAKPIFGPLKRGEDPVYDQVIEGLGAVSEYCLPSLLSSLLAWYHYQLDYEDGLSSTSVSNTSQQPQQQRVLESSLQNQESLSFNDQDLSLSECCGSPSCQTDAGQYMSLNQLARSPAPSSPELNSVTNQISIASSLPLDYQSPSPLTTINLGNTTLTANQSDIHQQSNNSAADTSNSSATNANPIPNTLTLDDSTNTIKRLELMRTRGLLIEYVFCQALIEIFSKLYLHPGHEDLIVQVEDIAFEHFKHMDSQQQQEMQQLHGVEMSDINKLADTYAEVIGVLAKTRFKLVMRRFMSELNELRSREPTSFNIQCIVTLLGGMKFFRVKMAPIEEFEESFRLLQELADYFIEVRHKSVRHALADLFVEIMLPLATIVKNEVKIPCLKNFVDTLWTPTLEMCTRKKHSSTLFPLVTCLLCVSQKAVFLQNWSPFLNMCQSNLKNRDQKMCRIALDSLYRLIWMYMIRIKCESNNVTQTRLNSIIESLFPKGSRQIVPRDTPLCVFVDIIHFIAQERLDFAMRHIIFELLSVDRSFKVIIAPERMNIGLQAFLLIADSLQQKDSDPQMPLNIGTAHQQQSENAAQQQQQQQNNNHSRRSATNHRMLTDDLAKSIGLHPYLNHVQKSFNVILRALDSQFGRTLMLTCYPNTNKDLDEIISADRRPKIDLFKTCIAAIPRLIPDGMSKVELIDLLSRMSIHVDEEMRRNALEALQTLVTDFQDWRLDAIEGYTLFLANQIDESLKYLVDGALKMLLQLVISWRALITSASSGSSSSSNNLSSLSSASASALTTTAAAAAAAAASRASVVSIQSGYETISSRNSGSTGGQIAARKNRALAEMRLIQSELSNTRFDRLVNVIQKVEGASLVMLCSCHHQTRKLASHLLRECRTILKCYSSWTCMEQFGFRSPDEQDASYGAACGADGDDQSGVSLKGSLSADNLSRITTTSGANGPLAHTSATSMNTQAALSTSISKMCISSASYTHLHNVGGGGGGGAGGQQQQQHDLYDEDIENNLADCYSKDDNSTSIFWIAVMMLESSKEHEYTFALRLLRKILPNLPFEQQDFVVELDRQLVLMGYGDGEQSGNKFQGIHALVLKGCASAATYDLCIALLDHMTPILRQRVCIANKRPEECLPAHVLALVTNLLSTYEDPTPSSLNIARRIALCCEENSQKFENLSAVMTLYSRRSFSKDAFQWIKCIAKYLNDACAQVMPSSIGFLVDLLDSGPPHIQRLVLPIVYCILTYIDIGEQPAAAFNGDLFRIYTKCLKSARPKGGSSALWRDAVQIFKLIISKSSSLAVGAPQLPISNNGATPAAANLTFYSPTSGLSVGGGGFASLSAGASAKSRNASGSLELPGRTMEFGIEIEKLPVIGRTRLLEFGANLCALHQQQPQQSVC